MTDNDYRIEDRSEKGEAELRAASCEVRGRRGRSGRERDAHVHLAWLRSDGRACGGGRVSGHGPVADGQVRFAR